VLKKIVRSFVSELLGPTFFLRSFLHQKYESTGQSTYLTAIRQEQLLRQGDSTVEDFFDQLSVV
jgi:hypothetical protein